MFTPRLRVRAFDSSGPASPRKQLAEQPSLTLKRNVMKCLHVLTPVKDSIDFTLDTIRAVMGSKFDVPFTYTVYNDFSTDENTRRLEEAARRVGKEIQWIRAGGLSDGNRISAVGIPTLDGLGPSGFNLHSDKEYLDLKSIDEHIKMGVSLLTMMAEQKS